MDAPYQGAPDVHVLPANLAIPGLGVLPINAFLLTAQEPVLVDTGLGDDADALLDAVDATVGLKSLRWVWLTHDDADHTGAIARVMEAAPNATLVTHALGALRMATWWPVPMDRVHAIRPGDEVHVGDRTLTAVAPPLFDSPLSIGFQDGLTGSLFTVDAFGAILPEATQSAGDVPPEALAGGMLGWATTDSPWTHDLDHAKFGHVLDRVRRLQPTGIFSAHLPAADGTQTDDFLRVLATVPDAEPFVPPSAGEFAQMIAAMTAAQQGIPEQRAEEAPVPTAPSD
jgi:hypothetical protein